MCVRVRVCVHVRACACVCMNEVAKSKLHALQLTPPPGISVRHHSCSGRTSHPIVGEPLTELISHNKQHRKGE